MFRLFKKKNTIDPLYNRLILLQSEARELYKTNRSKSEEKLFQAYDLIEEIKKFRSNKETNNGILSI